MKEALFTGTSNLKIY